MEQDELLTPGEAGDLLGVTDETMRRWAKDKKVRHIALPGGRMRFRRSDVEELLTPVEPESTVAS